MHSSIFMKCLEGASFKSNLDSQLKGTVKTQQMRLGQPENKHERCPCYTDWSTQAKARSKTTSGLRTNISSHRSPRIHTASAQTTTDLAWALIFLVATWEQKSLVHNPNSIPPPLFLSDSSSSDCASTAGGTGSIPGWGTNHMMWPKK